MSLVQVDGALARAQFLKKPFALKHSLAGNPLFTLPRLIELANTLPRDSIEYNAGNIPVDVKREDIPRIDKSPEAVIKSIETDNAWMVIKRVEQDPAYKAVLEQFVRDANIAAGREPGSYSDLQGFIFVSSAKATTPFHIDMEENILIQLKGDKFVHTFDNDDCSLVSEEDMEFSPAGFRTRRYDKSFEQRATRHALKPGDAVHMPYTIPHWVSTGETYSISMAMTWKTPEVLRLNKLRLMNGTLRHYGFAQAAPGASPIWDAAKVMLHDVIQAVLRPLRKSERLRVLIRGLVYGKTANYYMEQKQGM